MASKIEKLPVVMVVDCVGDYGVGIDIESAKEDYANRIQAVEDCDGFRIVNLTVNVPLPEVVELAGTAPDSGEASMTVA